MDLHQEVGADATFVDNGHQGEWRNHRRAITWAAQRPGITHVLVVQDDAVPVPDILLHAHEAASRRPDDLISLYVGTNRPRRKDVLDAVQAADDTGASWLRADSLLWGVAVIYPVEHIEAILESCSRPPALPYDQRVGRWAQQNNRDVWYTWPSLVDHRDTPTVISGRSPREQPRVAHRTGVPEWNERSVRIADV